MKTPDFFIIGAPKCGTTSLANWLGSHSDIFMPSVKESHHYARDLGYSDYRDADKYAALFRDAGPQISVIGEASAGYMHSETAIPAITAENPFAKFIVMLRNPVEMAQSLHQQLYFDGDETIASFEKAWAVQDERIHGRGIPIKCREPKFLIYRDVCCLGKYLNNLFSVSERENVLVLLLDDVRKDPRKEWIRVLSFLSVPDDGRTEFPVFNEAKVRRFQFLGSMASAYVKFRNALNLPPLNTGFFKSVNKMNNRSVIREELSPNMSAMLNNAFRSDVELLSKLLNRNLDSWLVENRPGEL